MAKLVNEFILQACKEELRCLKSELRMSHKVQINSSPQSSGPVRRGRHCHHEGGGGRDWEAVPATFPVAKGERQ